ncbi:hypothetical protein Tco_0370509 [Tanacetum coccineum]
MVAPIISILSDSSKKSVGSHAPQVILFGTILAIIPVIPEVPIAPADPIVAPEVGVVFVISPTRVLDLVDYSSSSDADPSKDSLLVVPELPLVSPFLCCDDLKADSESEPAEQRIERHESLTPTSEFPLAPLDLFPARRLAWRRVSYRSSDHHSSPDFTSDSSSSSSSSESSLDISSGSSSDSLSDSTSVHSSGQSHSGPSNRVVVRLMCIGDSSSPSAGPSSKRFISPATLVPSYTPVSRSVAPALTDLLPCKSNIREDEEEFEAKASEGGTMEIVVDHLATGDISEPTGGDAPNLKGTLYDMSHYMSEVPLDRITEFETTQRQLEAGQLEASKERASFSNRVRSLGRENLRVQALLCIERDRVDSRRRHIALSQEEFHQVRRDRDDTRRRLRRTMTITHFGMTPEAIEELVNRRVEEALAAYEATRAANVLEAESQSQNGSDGDNRNGGN